MDTSSRCDGRSAEQLRPIEFVLDFAPNASGSVLACYGNTRVICAASLEQGVPRWMSAQGVEGGWMSSEYSMLPYSTLDRKKRDINRGKQDGRSVEIQRLIGRSMRAVADLKKLPGFTLWLDCDVLQADGGTRTASVTGAWVALELACRRLVAQGLVDANPVLEGVAAVSVGIVDGTPRLDLDYDLDRNAQVDMNVVATASGGLIEVQGTAEGDPFAREELDALLDLAMAGIGRLLVAQQEALSGADR